MSRKLPHLVGPVALFAGGSVVGALSKGSGIVQITAHGDR
jgi:hypothetical protein